MMRSRFVLLAAGVALALAGCSSPLPSTDLPPARFVQPAPEFPGLRDYRGVVDLAIKPSGLDQSAVADLAKTAQIDFIVLGDSVKAGDSDFGIGGFTNDILFIPGGAFAAGDGEIVAVNLRAALTTTVAPADLIAEIHDQGGLAIARDPAKFSSSADYALADGIEVYNQRAAWSAVAATTLDLRAIFFGTDHFLSSLDVRPDANLALYDKLTSGARVAMLAGFGQADDLNVFGSKVGTLEQLFLFYTTHLLARERDTAPLLEALRLGHSYVSFDYLGYVGAFAFFAQNGDSKTGSMTMMGDEAQSAPGLALKAELPANADRIVMLQNGAEVASAENSSKLEFTPKAPGAYRIEAYRKTRMWILSNPVYVR